MIYGTIWCLLFLCFSSLMGCLFEIIIWFNSSIFLLISRISPTLAKFYCYHFHSHGLLYYIVHATLLPSLHLINGFVGSSLLTPLKKTLLKSLRHLVSLSWEDISPTSAKFYLFPLSHLWFTILYRAQTALMLSSCPVHGLVGHFPTQTLGKTTLLKGLF